MAVSFNGGNNSYHRSCGAFKIVGNHLTKKGMQEWDCRQKGSFL